MDFFISLNFEISTSANVLCDELCVFDIPRCRPLEVHHWKFYMSQLLCRLLCGLVVLEYFEDTASIVAVRVTLDATVRGTDPSFWLRCV